MSLLSYSSLTDILALSGLNKPVSSLIKHEVKHMVALSNPHFVTHDFFVNALLFVLIRDHFTIDSSSISYPIITDSPSPHIYDSLELLSARYFHDALDFDSTPRNVYYYAICFFNELLYGPDTLTPATFQEFNVQLIRKLTQNSQKPSFERTANFMLQNTNCPIWRESFTFFYTQRPSDADSESVKKFFGTNFSRIHKHFKVAVLECIMVEDTPIDLLRAAFRNLTRDNLFSQKLFEKLNVTSMRTLLELTYPGLRPYAVILKAASHSIAAANPEANVDQFYLFTRSSLQKFVLDEEKISYLKKDIKLIIPSIANSLAQLDALAQIFQSNHFSLDDFNEALNDSTAHRNVFIFEILLKEYAKRFGLASEFFSQALPLFPDCLAMVELFLDLRRSDDPFIFLTLNVNSLLGLKGLIQKRIFNVNKRYKFDTNPFLTGRENSMARYNLFEKLQNEVLTFKEIINLIDVPELHEIFRNSLKYYENAGLEENVYEDAPVPVSSYFF